MHSHMPCADSGQAARQLQYMCWVQGPNRQAAYQEPTKHRLCMYLACRSTGRVLRPWCKQPGCCGQPNLFTACAVCMLMISSQAAVQYVLVPEARQAVCCAELELCAAYVVCRLLPGGQAAAGHVLELRAKQPGYCAEPKHV